ncbi:MAG TPA: transcriptional repressor [Erysipelotrichaceae bacterium]|nr:transcriptional repressor [Erysipelotrichaceae bacterium]
MKHTKQKEIILDAVFDLKYHPTADEIYLHLKKDHPRLSLATVYRNLNIYTEEGKVRKVSIPGDSDRFDFNLSYHEHFYCEKCNKVYDIQLNLKDVVNKISPFTVSSYKLMLYGSCEMCSSTQS